MEMCGSLPPGAFSSVHPLPESLRPLRRLAGQLPETQSGWHSLGSAYPGDARMNVGFIGLGRMGRGLARRILTGGHHLAVYDIVASQLVEAVEAGASAAASIADACKDREI